MAWMWDRPWLGRVWRLGSHAARQAARRCRVRGAEAQSHVSPRRIAVDARHERSCLGCDLRVPFLCPTWVPPVEVAIPTLYPSHVWNEEWSPATMAMPA